MTNSRSAGADDALRLIPPREMTLEQALDYIAEDELAEITPSSIRLRKRILDPTLRMRANRNKVAAFRPKPGKGRAGGAI